MATLSGGNQQKVVLGKWLQRPPRVLLLDEPTRGVDVGAREEIYALVAALAARGVAVLMASSDLPEVLRLADRILVLRDGRVVGELPAGTSQEHIVAHSTGLLPPIGAEACPTVELVRICASRSLRMVGVLSALVDRPRRSIPRRARRSSPPATSRT